MLVFPRFHLVFQQPASGAVLSFRQVPASFTGVQSVVNTLRCRCYITPVSTLPLAIVFGFGTEYGHGEVVEDDHHVVKAQQDVDHNMIPSRPPELAENTVDVGGGSHGRWLVIHKTAEDW